MQQACGKCHQTVYSPEKQEAGSHWYHKGCFKCSDADCKIQLSLKSFTIANDALYCKMHTPKHVASVTAENINMQHALHAPKKAAEGTSGIFKGTGEKPTIGLDSIAISNAVHAPKKNTENLGFVQKGISTGGLSQ